METPTPNTVYCVFISKYVKIEELYWTLAGLWPRTCSVLGGRGGKTNARYESIKTRLNWPWARLGEALTTHLRLRPGWRDNTKLITSWGCSTNSLFCRNLNSNTQIHLFLYSYTNKDPVFAELHLHRVIEAAADCLSFPNDQDFSWIFVTDVNRQNSYNIYATKLFPEIILVNFNLKTLSLEELETNLREVLSFAFTE